MVPTAPDGTAPIAGQTYVVLTGCNTTVTDDTVAAGPAIFEVCFEPFNSSVMNLANKRNLDHQCRRHAMSTTVDCRACVRVDQGSR